MRFFIPLLLLVAAALARNIDDEVHHKQNRFKDRDHLHIGADAPPMMKLAADGQLRAVEDSEYWNEKCQQELKDQLAVTPIVSQAKNVIFFLADGTGVATLTAARLLKGLRTGMYEQERMAWDLFPYSSLIKTYNTNNQVTDSAASATAYLNGVKGNQATIGVDANVQRGDCQAMNVPEYRTQSLSKDFQDENKSAGIVTMSRVTDASPAGTYGHTADRNWESDSDINDDGEDTELCDDLAEQLVLNEPGSKFKVILGGGRQKFLPEGVDDPEEEDQTGRRNDGKNLIDAWLEGSSSMGNATYVWHKDDLLSFDAASTNYLLGLFDYKDMSYAIDEDASNPSLEEMTRAAIAVLQKDSNGYFLFVEGALIDKANHDNEASSALEEAVEFDKAVAAAVEMTDESDTLIIVTADHSQPMTINGYPALHSDIRGVAGVSDVDDIPYLALIYTSGPGYREQTDGVRPDPTEEGYEDPHYVFAAAVPREASTHNGEDVILYARGPHAHLFTGNHENAYITHAIRYAACVGDGLNFCDEKVKV
uniref:Alkaline phosphatase n=1 Tax=Hirondellea gigas TaxID=1518452 RepID=A0A6A7GAM1_9CRUS